MTPGLTLKINIESWYNDTAYQILSVEVICYRNVST